MIRFNAAITLGAFSLDAAFESDARVLALFGRSGAGKSVTIALIAGLMRPDRGQITVDERVLVDTEAKIFVPKHARRIGVVYQALGENQKALELVQGLLSRVDPSTLPGEFFDTLGAIQEAVGRPRDAEESYTKGLRKSPDNPALNFHMGKLLVVADARRSGKAKDYLVKAQAARQRLTPSMAAEVDSLMDKVRRN